MLKKLLPIIVLTTLLAMGCIGPKTQTSGTTTESPKTPGISSSADVVFEYGRLLSYWTNEDRLASDQIIKGLSTWRLQQIPSKMQQAQQENQVILRSLNTIPNESHFQPTAVETEGSLYAYTLPFRINEAAKPETIFVPPPLNTWSQFSTGLKIDSQVIPSDIQKGLEIVTIEVTPQRSFSQVWVSIETDKDAILLTDTASPPMTQWNVSTPQLGKTFSFSVQLQLKNIANGVGLYKPKAFIGAMVTPVSQKKQSGQSLEIDVPELGSLSFQTANAGVLELDKSDQIAIYLWQSVPITLSAPVKGWGLCKSLDVQQNPVGSLLLFSSEDTVTFWADIDSNAFENAAPVRFDWIDPSGKSRSDNKVIRASSDKTRFSETISLKELGESKIGIWHVRLLLDGESIITAFFLVATSEELKNSPVSAEQINVPHFVVGDKPFYFVGAFAPDGSFNQISADKLISTAKMSGLSVLTVGLPYSQNLGDESSLKQLDVFLDRASAHGVYVIVTLVHGFGLSLDKASPWYTPRGVEGLIHDQKLKAAYKDLLTRVVTRKNTVNGKMYRDDPTIMAWDLITEPIIPTFKTDPPKITGDEFRNWTKEMASYTKSLDPNHLVTMCLTGSIGFFKDWLDVIMPELDFFFSDTQIYDLYVHTQSLGPDYLEQVFQYPIFSMGKPVVIQLAFTTPNLTEKFAADYALQGQIYQAALQQGFQRGMAGGTVFCWGTKAIKGGSESPYISSFEYYLTYNATNEQIVIPLLKIAASLGTLDWPKPPLQFVRVAP